MTRPSISRFRCRRTPRAAFSLVEMLVVIGLVVGLVAGVTLYYVSGQKQSLDLDFQAASVQTAQMVIGLLQQDLSSMIPGPLVGTYAQPAPSLVVRLTRVSDVSDARGLPLDAHEALVSETTTWAFDPATHVLSRNGEPIHAELLESVEFTFFPSRPNDPTPPYGDTLSVRMVLVPFEALGRVTAQTPKAIFTAEFHSPQGTVNHAHEDWVGDQ